MKAFLRKIPGRSLLIRAVVAACVFCMFLCASGCVNADDIARAAKKKTVNTTLSTIISTVDKDGSLILKISKKSLTQAGFKVGDLVRVTIKKPKREYLVPIWKKDLGWGKTSLDISSSKVKLIRFKRNLARREGISKAKAKGAKVTITLAKKGGYSLPDVTDDISDYGNDEERFANFRAVATGDIAPHTLYRSYSPISDHSQFGGRTRIVNSLMQREGIRTVLSLNMDEGSLSQYLNTGICDYYRSLHDAGGISAIRIVGNDISAKEFREPLATHLRFMINHEGPYLVHCAIGRDRTGFVIGLLEALMGAGYDEIAEDYAITYRNYYNVKKNSILDTYFKTYFDDNIVEWTGGKGYIDVHTTDLKKAAENYLKNKLKLSEEEITKIRERLR